MDNKQLAAPAFPMTRCPFSPPPEYEQIRSGNELSKVTMPDGTLAWIFTKHEDVRAILGDNRFSTKPSTPGYPFISPARASLLINEDPPALIRMDAPEHTKFRRMLTKEFMFAHIEKMRPFIQKTVNELLDSIEAKGTDFDLAEDFALALPTTLIVNLLGVPYEDRDYFQERSQAKLDMSADPEVPIRATREMREYLDKLITEKMANPEKSDDLITRLINAQLIPGNMNKAEALSLIELLLMGGHETTANMIALGTLSMLMYPEQRAEIIANPALVPNAVEEMLRYHTINHFNGPRVALEDITVGGQLIKKGEGVLALIAAANRDPAAFEDPDKFDIHRKAVHHLAFSYGVHQCIGQPLARAELQIVFSTLFQRFPHMALTVPVEQLDFRYDGFVYGVKSLPVTTAAPVVAAPKAKKFFTIDASKCVGGGMCVMAAPKVFAQNEDDGLVIVLDDNPPPEQHEAVREAARLCPAIVIKINE